MNIFSNYPSIISSAIIPMIIAIFALGFPLLIQTIGRIDDKYNSTMLIKTFRKDWISKCFLTILIGAIVSYIIWLCQIPPLRDWGWFVDNSALILITISTIALMAMTFFIVYLTYIYYVPDELLNRLIRAYNKTHKLSKKKLYFDAISKLLYYSINKADEDLARTLMQFYYDAFISFRKDKEGQIIEYPQEFYNSFFEANELICNRKRKTFSLFNNSALFDLFLDQYQKTVVSAKTYNFLWRLIIQSVLYDKDDVIIAYWGKAHQLCDFYMQNPNAVYNDKYEIQNQAEIDKKQRERNDFIEFHYALGGLLMYKQKYNTIKELMYYTQSIPPRYVLVPESMEEVINRYMQIDRNENSNPVYYVQRYWFPDINGINDDGIIRMWIKRYIAILFIRQYTLQEYYVYSQRLEMPKLPHDLSELKHWEEELTSLENYVNDYLKQEDVLKELGLEQLCNQNWFEENNKIRPSDLIANLKTEIENKYNKIKAEQPIASNKENEFYEATKDLLIPIFQKYKEIFTNNEIGDLYEKYFINGQHYTLDKAAFSSNQDISYINTDSISAEAVAMNFQYYALNALILIKPQKYLLTEKDLFKAIDKLNISNDFVLIYFGLVEYFKFYNISGLEKINDKWYYKKDKDKDNEIEIIEIDNYINDLVSQSAFILRKKDLPNMIFNKVKEETIQKYHFCEPIDETFNIYAKINDLNKEDNEEIRKEAEQNNNQVDLSQKVLACVDINVEIQYKPNAKCIQLKVFSQFDDRGKANEIEDVKTIW
ncbi:MAG: hypothetical protein P4L28_01120 [Paludibacteraceae bacterium]|nr:hypothetical protein [Paludibacteraceae bacterium]